MERRNVSRTNGDDIRTECYQEIRYCLKKGLQDFYRSNPDLLMDERSKLAIDASMEGLRCMLQILDKYEITRRS